MGPDRPLSNHVYPVIVPVPTDILSGDVIHIPLDGIPKESWVYSVKGFLQKLQAGPFTVELRDMMDGALIATLNWLAAGDSVADGKRQGDPVDSTVRGIGSGIKVGVTSTGIGAAGCTLVIWMRITT